MKRFRWYVFLVGSLISLSFVFYMIQIAIFHRAEDTFFYMLQDIAFVPIQVLMVTIIIERLLNERERIALLKKLNMLIGSFYSEAGTHLIKSCSRFNKDISELSGRLLISTKWTDRDFSEAIKFVRSSEPKLNSRHGDLNELKRFLEGKRGFLLSLLVNPNLLEHDTFTDLLWAVFHLNEELSIRESLEGLPTTDYDHLSGDIKRAYALLIIEWLSYMKHLKSDYPYLFSLAVRTNPLDSNANPVVT